jgi:2-polyprenyl-3-methyl-5-hydroxy-6-metoxy-1,4-benzoquinol methylase
VRGSRPMRTCSRAPRTCWTWAAGRGEFLALLAERGVSARGIDVNESMVEVCRQKWLSATREDALACLRAQPAGSLGGLLAAQVVEHVDPG